MKKTTKQRTLEEELCRVIYALAVQVEHDYDEELMSKPLRYALDDALICLEDKEE